MTVLENIIRISNTLSWRDIERFCKENNFDIIKSKKGYKVKIKSSVWSVHLEHRTSDKLKFGIIRELKRVLIKENVI